MFAFFGFVVFVTTWCFVARRLGNVGAGGLRRHLFGFLAATIALGFGAAVSFPHADAPEHLVAQAAQHPQIVERPAATPASAAEWAEIQKFVRDIWTIGSRQGQAQGRLKTTVATLAAKYDLNGIRKAQIKYLAQLDDALAALERVHVPKVANEDAEKFISKAYGSLNDKLLIEREETVSFVKGLKDSRQIPSNEEIVSMNNDINRKTALMVVSLHRIYWNYGYSNEDFDEKTFAIKAGAKSQSTISFNPGDS